MAGILKNKNYILVITAAALFYTAVFMLNSVCGRYTVETGGSKAAAGVATCAFTLSSFFTRPVWGWITDAKSRKNVLVSGAVVCLLSAAVLIFTKTVTVLVIARAVFGVGYSAFTTAGGTIICDVVENRNLPAAISFYGITNVLSQAVSPGLALWLYNSGFAVVSAVAAAIMAVVTVGSFFVKYDENSFLNKNGRFRIFEKTALPASAVIVFFALCTASVYSFIPIMTQEKNLNGTGRFFLLSAAGLLFSRLTNPAVCRKVGENTVFYIGVGLFSAGFAGFAVAENTAVFLVSAVLYGLGAGFVHPVVNTAAVSECGAKRRGLATGTFMMSQDRGMTVGALLWGFISEKAGFSAVYFSAAASAVVMVCVFAGLLAHKAAKANRKNKTS